MVQLFSRASVRLSGNPEKGWQHRNLGAAVLRGGWPWSLHLAKKCIGMKKQYPSVPVVQSIDGRAIHSAHVLVSIFLAILSPLVVEYNLLQHRISSPALRPVLTGLCLKVRKCSTFLAL